MVDIPRFNKLEVRGEMYEIYVGICGEGEASSFTHWLGQHLGLANILARPHSPARLAQSNRLADILGCQDMRQMRMG